MQAVGVATHKVLMCQPYDIYCLGEARALRRVETFIMAASWSRQLAAPATSGKPKGGEELVG